MLTKGGKRSSTGFKDPGSVERNFAIEMSYRCSMKKRLLVSAIIAASSLFPASVGERITKVERGLAPRIQIDGEAPLRWAIPERQLFHKVPGVSVAVVNDGNIDWAKGYGDGITSSTRFQAASISKPVAAVTALRLVVRGQLKLDEDVNQKLKSWKIPENKWGKPLTVRQLLSHTAGLTVHGFPGYTRTAAVPTLVQILKGEKPANTAAIVCNVEPGSIHRYSGGGYEVLQLLIEDATRMPFAAVVKSLVLDPANMKDSGYDQPPATKAALAHDREGEPVPGGWNIYPEQAAAGLWTTPSDLARFLLAVKASKLLPEALTAEMLTPVKDDYALGFGIEGSGEAERFGHNGANRGYRCSATLYRKRGQGVVIMTNGDNGSTLANEIGRAVAEAYGWPSGKSVPLKIAALSDAEMRAFTGEYQDGDVKLKITPTGRSLRVSAFGQVSEFVPETGLRFVPLGDGAPTLVFEKDGAGRITGLTAGGRKMKKL
jgi:CubicO group peptidase (beta-lactamase class C family)